MTAGSLAERLWLWLVVHIGTRQSSPRQFLRFWLVMGVVWLVASAFGVWGLAGGQPYTIPFVVVTLTMLVISVLLCRIAAADLRSPRAIEGRVVRMDTVAGKGYRHTAAAASRRRAEEHGYYSHRVTIAEGNGDAHTFRVAINAIDRISEGDAVSATVGMRLRWIYEIQAVEGR